jgi:transcriptional regulator with XRE-family HTH domain
MTCVETENSEQTIRRVLSGYDLGNKLRMLRMRKKIGLVDLGKHTGLSASMLSQLENGKLVPTLPTLARIGMVFDVGLDYFFIDPRRRQVFHIVRAGDRILFPDRAGNPKPDYFFECLAFSSSEKGIEAYIAEFPRRPTDEQELHYHDGSELLFILQGELGLRYQGEEHVLLPGDSVYFDGAEPHSYRGRSEVPARAVVVTALPRL